MKICIVGGGNIGTAMAVDFANKGHSVRILTSKPELWSRKISAVDIDTEETIETEIDLATSDVETALDSADLIFVTLPSNVQKGFVEKSERFVQPGMKFVLTPGFGGSEFIFEPLMKKQIEFYGMQRVPYIARVQEYGRRVNFSRKKSLQTASLKKSADIHSTLETLFDIPCECLPNFLCVTLTPSNPILHTARIFSLFRDLQPTSENLYFYASWSDESSRILLEMDEELQKICCTLPEFDLKAVRSLKDHYEASTVEAMTRKLSSIKSLKNILSPMKKIETGWIPDFDNRYFICDFAYGLDILLQFAQILRTPAEKMNKVMSWYRTASKNFDRAVDLKSFGIETRDDIIKFYSGVN